MFCSVRVVRWVSARRWKLPVPLRNRRARKNSRFPTNFTTNQNSNTPPSLLKQQGLFIQAYHTTQTNKSLPSLNKPHHLVIAFYSFRHFTLSTTQNMPGYSPKIERRVTSCTLCDDLHTESPVSAPSPAAATLSSTPSAFSEEEFNGLVLHGATEDWTLGKTLGEGAFASVRLGRSKSGAIVGSEARHRTRRYRL